MPHRQHATGIHVVVKCPTCMEEYDSVAPYGSGVSPGQVLWQPHLGGLCPQLEIEGEPVPPPKERP